MHHTRLNEISRQLAPVRTIATVEQEPSSGAWIARFDCGHGGRYPMSRKPRRGGDVQCVECGEQLGRERGIIA